MSTQVTENVRPLMATRSTFGLPSISFKISALEVKLYRPKERGNAGLRPCRRQQPRRPIDDVLWDRRRTFCPDGVGRGHARGYTTTEDARGRYRVAPWVCKGNVISLKCEAEKYWRGTRFSYHRNRKERQIKRQDISQNE